MQVIVVSLPSSALAPSLSVWPMVLLWYVLRVTLQVALQVVVGARSCH